MNYEGIEILTDKWDKSLKELFYGVNAWDSLISSTLFSDFGTGVWNWSPPAAPYDCLSIANIYLYKFF